MKKISILIITILALVVWKPIASQVPMGEGYYYFDNCQNTFIQKKIGCNTTIWQYDNLARISFQAMIPIFKDNIHLYMFSQLGIMIAVYVSFFLLLARVTRNDLFSLFTTIIFLSSFTGSFSMMATGNYQRFIQRTPNLIPMFVSFYCLHKFLHRKTFINIASFATTLFASLFLSHHGVFLLPFFLSYILTDFLNKKTKIKDFATMVVIVILIILLTYFVTKADHFVPKIGPINFVMSTKNIFEKTILQIPNLLIPQGITKYIAQNWPGTPLLYPFVKIQNIWAFILVSFLTLTLFIKRDRSNTDLIYKSSVIALPLVCLLNLYAYGSGTPDPLRNFGEDRIYFIPSLLGSVILGYLLHSAWKLRGLWTKIFTGTLIVSYTIYNSHLISLGVKTLSPNSIKMYNFIKYVKIKTIKTDTKIVFIGPSHLLWPNPFLSNFYNTNDNLYFILDSSDWSQIINRNDWDRILLVGYDDKTNTVITEKIIK